MGLHVIAATLILALAIASAVVSLENAPPTPRHARWAATAVASAPASVPQHEAGDEAGRR